ncbi:MAG: pyridoxal phosphate-dependent aminotransferase family protein [Pseudomonadota bacterium]
MPLAKMESPGGAHMVIDRRQIINFGGAPYLGLSDHPAIIASGQDALRRYGSTGQLPRHYDLASPANLDAEAAASDFFGVEAAMYFATGYFFGLIVLPALSDDYDVALLDENAHYNLFEGARAADREIVTFRHRDADDLADHMERVVKAGKRPLVATDGMFATYGTSPPLNRYRQLLDTHAGWLVIDESHSFGCIGPTGRGAYEAFGVQGDMTIFGGSMAKSFCAHGGMAMGSSEAIARCWKTPSARGAVSGTSAGAAMTATSLKLVADSPDLLQKLRRNADYMKMSLRHAGYDFESTDSPVAAFECGSARYMAELQQHLWRDGIFVIYSNYVGAGPEGAIRIAAFSDHEFADFDRLIDSLQRFEAT